MDGILDFTDSHFPNPVTEDLGSRGLFDNNLGEGLRFPKSFRYKVRTPEIFPHYLSTCCT